MNIVRTVPAMIIALATIASAAPAAAPAAKPAEASKPAASAAKPAEASKPAAQSAAVTPAVAPAPAPAKFASDAEKYSYAIGLDVGESLKRVELSLDLFQVFKGIDDMVIKDSSKILLTGDERREVINELMVQIQKAAAVKDSLAALENEKKAKDFLDKNKKAKGVTTTKSGLQYTYLAKGKGKGVSPKATDDVTAHYVGTLLDGTEFDNSIKRGQPATFGLSNVIQGWQEVLPLMKVGDKVKCWIPPQLGYGSRGNSKIPANSLLVFEIELIAVPSAEKPAEAVKPAVTAPAVKAAEVAKPAAAAPAAKPAETAKPAAAAPAATAPAAK